MSHGHSHGAAGNSHGSVKSYTIGFIISIILTVIPFWMVMQGGMSPVMVVLTILGTGVLQVLVQLVFFLHMNGSSEQRWNVLAFLFAVKVMFIVVAGTVWVMVNMRYFMMPH